MNMCYLTSGSYICACQYDRLVFAWTSRRHYPYVDLSPQLKAGRPCPALHSKSGAGRYSDDTISLATYHIGNAMHAKAIPIVEFQQLDLKRGGEHLSRPGWFGLGAGEQRQDNITHN